MAYTVTIAGTDRTATVDGVDDLRLEDVRGGSVPTLTVSLMGWVAPWATTPPTGGMLVTVADETRTYFTGHITAITFAPRDKTKWYHTCTVTSIKSWLDRVRVYERYTGTTYADEVIADAPVGYWRMGEAAGTWLVDGSGHGRWGTYTGSGVTYGATGAVTGDTAVTLDGSAGYASVADAAYLDVGDTFTLEVWAKRAGAGAFFEVLTVKGANAFVLYVNNDRVVLGQSGVGNIVTSTTTITDTNWHHVVATKTGATSKLYVDGADVTGTVTNLTCANTATALLIGANVDLGNTFHGSLDEFALYSTALSATRVTAHYAARSRTGLPAEDIAADLITLAPDFTLDCETGLAAVDEIVFDGCTLAEAFDQLAAYLGGKWYVDESWVVHFFVTTDGTVEQPDTLTVSNVQEFSRTEDYSQIVTRQCVEGAGTTVAVPVAVGASAICLADVSPFADSGTVNLHAGPAARIAYTGRHNYQAATTVTNPVAGTPVLYPTAVADLPASGWLFIGSSAAPVYYSDVIGTDPGAFVLLRGAYHIHSLTTVSTTATLTTDEATPLWAGTSLIIAGPGVGDWAGTYVMTGFPTANQVTFTFAGSKTPATLSDTGICYDSGTDVTATLLRSGREVTGSCDIKHRLSVGEWVTLSGSTEVDYNGTFQVTRVPSTLCFCFELDAAPLEFVQNVTVTPVGCIPPLASATYDVTACPMLTGVTVTRAVPAGIAAHVWAQCDDTSAQTALAALDGSDGIKEGPIITDGNLTSAGAIERGIAELTVRSSKETRLSYVSQDAKTRAGTKVTANVVTPDLTVGGTHYLTKVDFSRFRPAATALQRRVETSDKRFTPADLYRQLASIQK